MRVIDIYIEKTPHWMNRYVLIQKHNKHGLYYQARMEKEQAMKLERQLTMKRIRFHSYDEKLERASDCRSSFFQTHKPPYRCCYCNRKLSKEQMEIDHIIPVSRAQKSRRVRTLMLLTGIHNINSPKNLASSCVRCNRKKSNKMGLWYIRGILGKYHAYWFFLYAMSGILILAGICIWGKGMII